MRALVLHLKIIVVGAHGLLQKQCPEIAVFVVVVFACPAPIRVSHYRIAPIQDDFAVGVSGCHGFLGNRLHPVHRQVHRNHAFAVRELFRDGHHDGSRMSVNVRIDNDDIAAACRRLDKPGTLRGHKPLDRHPLRAVHELVPDIAVHARRALENSLRNRYGLPHQIVQNLFVRAAFRHHLLHRIGCELDDVDTGGKIFTQMIRRLHDGRLAGPDEVFPFLAKEHRVVKQDNAHKKHDQ